MIVFDLICRDQHRFEGWFSSGEDFILQQSRGLLNCPVCGVAHVERLPAAKIRKQAVEATAPRKAAENQQTTTDPAEVARVIDYVLTHSEDVGRRFAQEARKIYYEEAPRRNIRGIASPGEADDLREEGIPVFALPVPPQDQWN